MSFAAAAALSSIGDIGSAMLNQYYNKKNMRDQAKLEYEYAERYAKNSPTWNIQGLRDAGLNPMLAVSNGVNLGANIPNITNSSPKANINVPALEAFKASKEIDIGEQNAAANTTNAESQGVSAAADMLRAKSDAALKSAQTAETLQRTRFEKEGGGYKSDTVNDLMRGASKLSDAVQEINKESDAYLIHGPSRPVKSYTDSEMEKLYNESERTRRLRRFERYEEKNKNIPSLRKFIYQ